MLYRGFRFDFTASHKLYNPKWTAQKNREVFGPCASANWHGHNFTLYITLKGPASEAGYLIDEHYFTELVEERILSQLDQRNISVEDGFLSHAPATCEYIVQQIWHRLESLLKEGKHSAKLAHIKLYETKNNSVELGDIEPHHYSLKV